MRRATANTGGEKAGAPKLEKEVLDLEAEAAANEAGADKPLEAKPLPVPTPAQAQAAEQKFMPPVMPKIEQFIVSNHNGRNVMLHGGIVLLRQGKVVDNLNYDLSYLRSQGVELTPYGK